MSRREEGYQAIIPGLPDDIAIHCLGRISHGYHGVLECVSKRWRDVMRSSEYSHIKAINGWSGDWFFAFTKKQYVVEWNAYDPEANNWHHLPSIPTAEPHGHHHGFSCVCVCNKFFVMGGFHETFQGPLFPENESCETTDVWMFDPFKKQWSRRASMKMPRSWFSCVVMSGKVYVAGGFNCSKRGGVTNAEVYDPVEDRWEDLPPMPFPWRQCVGVSYQGRFHVIGNLIPDVPRKTHLFDPNNGMWHSVENFWPIPEPGMLSFHIAEIEEQIYVTTGVDANTIRKRNTETGEWCDVAVLPLPISQAEHIPLPVLVGYGFVGCGRKLYVVGGTAVKCNSDLVVIGIVRLNNVRFCNPMVSPLQWKKAKPMRGTPGSVLACAVLEE